jgi:hypothetical protein
MRAAWFSTTRRRAALVLTFAGASVFAVPAVAGAQEAPVQVYGGGTTKVTVPGDPADPAAIADTEPSGTLPFTGGDAAGLALIGAGAVGAGLVVSRVRRRRLA